jgi:uncharacterized membrane protein
MTIDRIIRNGLFAHRLTRKAFPRDVLADIKTAITASETRHRGELRFVIEGHLPIYRLLLGTTSRQRAERLFDRMGVNQTLEHSGILIYVLLAERRVEIVADSGIVALVAQATWDAICAGMIEHFRQSDFRTGALQGIAQTTELLASNFPAHGGNPNELPDAPVVL